MSKDEIVECIKEWMPLPDSIEDLAKFTQQLLAKQINS